MPMRFEFATATRIVFGAGSLREVAAAARALGRRALLLTGESLERARPLMRLLRDAGVGSFHFMAAGEPCVSTVREGANYGRLYKLEMVIAMGGGGVIDSGKAIAAMMTNPGKVSDYLEVIGLGQPLTVPAAPCIAIPTTAGTGAEVTRNAVLASPQHHVKVSMRSPLMLPRLAVIDPELTLSLPPAITASTGLDALTQLIEPFVSIRANPMTDAFCRDGLLRVRRSLRRAFHHGDEIEARTDMAMAALLGGLSLANAGLGVVHGFAGPIGGMFPAPHGAVCAALLPAGIMANLKALRARDRDGEAVRRYDEVGHILTGRPTAGGDDVFYWVSELCTELGLPPLKRYGISEGDVEPLVEKAMKASSMKANPIALTSEELAEALRMAL
jgi:alcohol dehydrogenase class IV